MTPRPPISPLPQKRGGTKFFPFRSTTVDPLPELVRPSPYCPSRSHTLKTERSSSPAPFFLEVLPGSDAPPQQPVPPYCPAKILPPSSIETSAILSISPVRTPRALHSPQGHPFVSQGNTPPKSLSGHEFRQYRFHDFSLLVVFFYLIVFGALLVVSKAQGATFVTAPPCFPGVCLLSSPSSCNVVFPFLSILADHTSVHCLRCQSPIGTFFPFFNFSF